MTIQHSATDRREFLAALAAAAALPSVARAKAPGGAHAAVRAMADRYVAEKKVANMVVAIGGREGPPDFVSAGTLELGSGPLAGPDSLYRIYSMTKCITGCAIMILVEQGKLTLDTPLSSIFPAYAKMNVLVDPANSLETRPATKPILIRHIVTHTSGLVYNNTAPPLLSKFYEDKGILPGRGTLEAEAQRPANLIAFAEAAAAMPLLFEPGTSWKYSIGLDIAGAVIEKVSGAPYDAFVADHILTPLGMADTSFTVPAAKLVRLAGNYKFVAADAPIELVETGLKSDYVRKPRLPSGGGGLASSARDYSKFMAMLLGEGQAPGGVRILKTETAKVMMSNLMAPGVLAPTTTYGPTGFGSGGRVAITPTVFGEAAGTYGWNGAASTQASVDRASGIYVVLMTQVMAWPTNTLHRDVSAAVYKDMASG